MPSKNELTGKEVVVASTTATNSNAVVTITAPPNSRVSTIYVTGIALSASAPIVAPVEATLVGVAKADGTSATIPMELPASAIAPVVIQYGVHPLRGVPGTNVVLTLPALGSLVVGTATIYYYIGAI